MKADEKLMADVKVMPDRVDVLQQIDQMIPGHEYTWEEFVSQYLDKENSEPEWAALRLVFKRLDSRADRSQYTKILSEATDGTLLDSLDIHEDDPFSEVRTPELQESMNTRARDYISKTGKDTFTLMDYFRDVYEHKFFQWMVQLDDKRDL